MPPKCPDDPPALLSQPICLSALSKDLRGSLKLNVSDPHKCAHPECETLKTGHGLAVKVLAHPPCDSEIGGVLNGTITVDRLITAFEKDGLQRGLHAGDFVWLGSGALVHGRMSGMTNVGTHREPAFEKCQTCDTRGVLEGRLCGEIVQAKNPALKGCQVLGVYRIRFKPSKKGGTGSVLGTFEGTIVCPCKP